MIKFFCNICNKETDISEYYHIEAINQLNVVFEPHKHDIYWNICKDCLIKKFPLNKEQLTKLL